MSTGENISGRHQWWCATWTSPGRLKRSSGDRGSSQGRTRALCGVQFQPPEKGTLKDRADLNQAAKFAAGARTGFLKAARTISTVASYIQPLDTTRRKLEWNTNRAKCPFWQTPCNGCILRWRRGNKATAEGGKQGSEMIRVAEKNMSYTICRMWLKSARWPQQKHGRVAFFTLNGGTWTWPIAVETARGRALEGLSRIRRWDSWCLPF